MGTAAASPLDDFEGSLTRHWIISRQSRVHVVESGDPRHGRVLVLQPDGDDVCALLPETSGWEGGVLEGDVQFPTSEDSYLGLIYNFHRRASRSDFGVIYIKGN